MNLWNKIFGPKADMLGFALDAKPSADQWLQAFTNDFMGHAEALHATQALMSGMRFYTPEFVAALSAPAGEGGQRHAMAGNIPKRIYASTGPIIADVYQRLISHDAPQTEIQAAFTQAVPVLIDHYRQKIMN